MRGRLRRLTALAAVAVALTACGSGSDQGSSGISVRIEGPKEARRAATRVLFDDPHRLSQAPYPDEDYWSR